MNGEYVLREATVLDRGGSFDGPLDVHVRDGRVVAVGRALSAPGVPSVDFSGLWLMPGVFDCHCHLSFSTVDLGKVLATPVTRWVLEAARNARTTLEAGVTFLRDLGGADRGLRDALAAGDVPGPTLQVAVSLIYQTGGHGDTFLSGAGLEATYVPDYPSRPPWLVDGPDAMRRVVRAVLRAGADWIKFAATGGLFSDPVSPELTQEEIEIAVSEAGRRGKPVAAHAYGGEALTQAVRAGVRSIEHGAFLSEEQAELMAASGCFLVPTLSASRDCLRWAEQGVLSPAQCEKLLGLGLDLGSCIRVAKDYGVPLAMGTDYIDRKQHGNNLEELLLMHRAGLSVEDTLLAATQGGAELCGVAGDHGRIAEGYVFDATVLDLDPGDLECFATPGAVTGVFKSGTPVVAHPRLASPAGAVAT
jgi:imidazolonepropionase-like amidohydrolase